MKEIRIAELRAAAPTADDAKALILQGRAILYDTPTTIKDRSGSYTEVIKRGALDDTDISDVRLLFNHDANKVPLARTPKTMTLFLDQAGLSFKATLPETASAKEVHAAVERGDLDGMSFAFTVPDGGDSYDAMTNTRTITKISKVYECSVVPYAAYPTTSVEARSIREKSIEELEKKENARILINQILKEV